ncbi:MAG: hypothetical protein Q8N08_05775 [Methanobacteriaceae archaeon]|nr:hypothetical protein [Methanobacteriaceae archaeon]
MAETGIVTELERQQFMKNCQNDAAFFAQNVLNDEYGEPYVLEDFQKTYLRCPAKKKVLFWARRLSKSLMIKMEILHKTTFNRAFKAMVVSPSWDQSIQFGEDIQDILAATPMLESMYDSTKTTKMKLKNNSRYYLVSAGRGGVSQIGKGVRYLAFDETQQIPDSTFVYLRPTLLGQKKGTDKYLVYAGTPLGRIGQFYDTYNKGKYYISLDGVYEGDTSQDYIVFERPTAILNERGEVIGTGTDRVSAEEMINEMRELPRTGFLREYCLQFLDQIGEVFPRTIIDSVVNYDAEIVYTTDAKCVMGLDLGKQRYNSVLTIGELVPKGIKVINVVEFDLGQDYHDIIDQVDNIIHDYPGTLDLRVDETGVGKGVIEIIERKLQHHKNLDVTGFDFSGPKKKKELVEAGVTEMEQGKVELVYNQKMISEMLEFRREITDKQNIIYRKPQGGSDDYVDSLLLCLLSARDYHDWTGEAGVLIGSGTQIMNRYYKKVTRMVMS